MRATRRELLCVVQDARHSGTVTLPGNKYIVRDNVLTHRLLPVKKRPGKDTNTFALCGLKLNKSTRIGASTAQRK